MNEIVILSGKGGTGKTSLAASFAVIEAENAIIADCDVDAADMHLLLNPDFEEIFDFYGGELAVIKQNKCIGCGKCADICRFKAIKYSDNRFEVSSIDCEGCGYCEKICEIKAMSMFERKSGYVFISNIKTNSKMVHAKLDIGAENSGKLVAKVKNIAKELAAKNNKPYIIVDGSPGIGCPVVSSLSGANYVTIVTEPTASGLHDLSRLYSVINKFRINSGCIINKSDINIEKTNEIKLFLEENNIMHLADIPYNINFTKTMIESKAVVEFDSPLKPLIVNIWNKIKTQLNN